MHARTYLEELLHAGALGANDVLAQPLRATNLDREVAVGKVVQHLVRTAHRQKWKGTNKKQSESEVRPVFLLQTTTARTLPLNCKANAWPTRIDPSDEGNPQTERAQYTRPQPMIQQF